MHVPQDSMWHEILKSFWFLDELNKVFSKKKLDFDIVAFFLFNKHCAIIK